MGSASMTTTTLSEVDFGDVQGLVRFGYREMKEASYKLLRVKNPAAARAWLSSAVVNNAKYTKERPETALHVAFTAPGLRELGVSETVIDSFSHEFRTGMATEYRARQLGDVGCNAQENWRWGRHGSEPHVLVMFFAEPEQLEAHMERSTGDVWTEAFEVQHSLSADLKAKEPFGFLDGISQPAIDWDQKRETPTTQLDYTNETALGEILLGYRNEYGKITDRPLLEPDAGNDELLAAQDAPDKKDLGRNGTYLVLRQLEQDVEGFLRFVGEQAGGDSAKTEKLEEAMVGRKRDGKPLVPIREQPIPGVKSEQNQFTFDDDPLGALCPFGSHVRRANPRNTDYPGRPGLLKKLIIALGFGSKQLPIRSHVLRLAFTAFCGAAANTVPRLIPLTRPLLIRSKATGPKTRRTEPEPKQGLHLICLNANISRQFEFVQNAWMATAAKFSGMTGESDPLLGNREPIPGCPVTSDFNMPQENGLRQRVSGLPQFIKVVGGAYFFLPSLRALRYFAGVETG